MNKTLHLSLCFLLALSNIPASALASKGYVTPPIYVSAINLNEQVLSLKRDILNQERLNRDTEFQALQLTQENKKMIMDIQQQHYRDNQPGDLVSYVKITEQLRYIMQAYDQQIDERNRAMMEKNEELGKLKSRVEKLEHLFDESIKLNSSVELSKIQEVSTKETSQDLVDNLTDYKSALEVQRKLLKSKDEMINKYTKELIESRDKLKELQSLLANNNSNEEITKLTTDIEGQMGQLKVLQAQLKSKDEAIAQHQAELLSKNQEIAELKNQLIQLKEQLSQKEVQLTQSNSDLKQIKTQLAQQESSAAKIKEELTQSNKADKAHQQVIKSQEELIDGLNLQIKNIKGEIETLRLNSEADSQGFQKIRENIILLKNKLKLAQERTIRVEAQEKELIQLKGELAGLTYQLENSKEDENKAKNQITQLSSQLNSISQQLILRDKTIQDLTQQLTNKEASIKDLSVQLLAKDEKMIANNQQIKQLEEKSKLIDVYKSQVVELKQRIDALQAQVEGLKGKIDIIDQLKDRVELQDELIVTYNELERLAAIKCNLLIQLAHKHQDKSQYYQEQLKKTILYWQELTKGTETKVQEIKDEIIKKQQEMETLKGELKESQLKAAEFESMLDVYQQKADEKEASFTAKLEEIGQLQGQLQTAQETITQREGDIQKVKDFFFELEKKSSEKAAQLKDRAQQLALIQEELNQQKTLNQELSAKINSLNQQPVAVQSKGMVDPRDYQILNQQYLQSQEQLQGAIKHINGMRGQLSQMKERLTVAETQLKTSKNEVMTDKTKAFLKSTSGEIELLKNQLNEKTKQIEKLSLDNSNHQELSNRYKDAKIKITKLMEESYYQEKQIERLKLQLKDKKIGLPSPKTVDVKSSKLEEYQERLNTLNEQLKMARQETIDARQTALEKNKQSRQLLDEVSALRKNIDALNKRIESLQHK